MAFLTSDYLERDPYRKLTVGLSHAFLGAFLAVAGMPLWIIALGYILKEVSFDILSAARGDGLWRVIPDSVVDLCFIVLGAAMVAYSDVRFGVGALAVGAAYFAVGKLNGR